jgi:pimeloyl-ACP methyl ester carboxylesterase
MRALVVISMLCAGCLADTLLLWPPHGDADYPERRRMLADPGGAIEVFVTPSSGEPDAFVLAMFGNGEVADAPSAELAAMLAEHGMRAEVWGVNYAGYGRSAGRASLDGVARSARRGYAELARRAAGKPIILYGSSMGTTAALHLAATVRVAGVVLKNPPPLPELILRRHGWWNLFLLALPVALQIPLELDSIANASRATAPAIFLSASDDEVVPIAYQERVMDAYAGPWRRFSLVGASHNDPLPARARRSLVTAIQAWVSRASS